jgi:hypothetical protein
MAFAEVGSYNVGQRWSPERVPLQEQRAMIHSVTLSRSDLSVLLRVVGSRKGADLDAIVSFEQRHLRSPPSVDEIQKSISRLMVAGYVYQQGKQYFGAPELQNAFFEEVRNCRDTVEEFDVLQRVLDRIAPETRT